MGYSASNSSDVRGNEQNLLSFSVRSGSDNTGTIENKLPREKSEKFHNLGILNIGNGLPGGPTGRNLHLGL